MSSVGSGSLTVEVVMAVSVQSRASCSGILVNSDFTSKDTSLWSSGICAVLIASIKFSVDCSLCLDWSVKGCSLVPAGLKLKSPLNTQELLWTGQTTTTK